MEIPLLQELVVIFCLSILVIYGCHRIKIPPIVGFLLTGVVCGPYGLKLVSAVHEVEILAEVGVVLLMFSIGMELSVSELVRLRKPVFLGGGLQVALTAAVVLPFAFLFGHHWNQALFIGFFVALSSTAIILKILQQTGQIESPYGRMTLSILIFQDLAIVPMMLTLPLLAGSAMDGDGSLSSFLLAGAKTLGIIVAVFLLARKAVPFGLGLIVRTRSRELFLIATLGICLSIAWITSSLGLSLSLGAFLAGLVMSESEYSHGALEGVLPFKDIFISLFFTSVGMLLDLSFFIDHIGQVGLATLLFILIKALVVTAVVLYLNYPLRVALISALALCQIGEFSFVLAKKGLDLALISPEHYQIALAASIITMAAAPFLLAAAPRFASLVVRAPVATRLLGAGRVEEKPEEVKDSGLCDHLVIIGFGLGGKYLARTAKLAGIPYTILEMNPDTVRAYAAKGEPISHGDATHPAVLQALGILRARMLVIVISDPAAVRSITETARHMTPGLHILVRTRFLGEVAALYDLGANEVIPEEVETAVEIFTRVLSRYFVPRADMERFIREVRSENYAILRTLDLPGSSLGALQAHIPDFNVTAVTVEPLASLDGSSLKEANLRQKTGLTVVAVRRGETTFANPDGDFRFQGGDVAYVFSSPEAVAGATPIFLAASGKG
ncbi:MAG: cation:proton antiporter [Desulfovibrio sp.]|jgi:CPA2 family monovalent cation:H+ antiporter-2|nr:cation:proton antiporter [Desulfovibrio sp.]